MKVEIKKTKITNAILKQVLIAIVETIANFEVLGWCLSNKGVKYIVLFENEPSALTKYPLFDRIKEIVVKVAEDGKGIYNVEVQTPRFVEVVYKNLNEDEKNNLINKLETIKTQAINAGQFFL